MSKKNFKKRKIYADLFYDDDYWSGGILFSKDFRNLDYAMQLKLLGEWFNVLMDAYFYSEKLFKKKKLRKGGTYGRLEGWDAVQQTTRNTRQPKKIPRSQSLQRG